MKPDFTLKQYEVLCQVIVGSGYHILTIEEYIKNQHGLENIIILRHDVDRHPANALLMAELEHSFGICSTYYFRHTSDVFKPSIIQRIAELGHEIGYHYETLSKARGDFDEALRLFGLELRDFRTIAKVQTISMHGMPLLPFDNRELWQKNDFKKFDLVGEAYLSIDYQKIQYYTDTGRTWQRTYFNLRDYTPEMKPDNTIKSTSDLMAVIHQKRYPRVCISAHPERWASNMAAWTFSFGFDLLSNLIKAGIHFVSRKKLK
jgi:hypothetical protein